MNRKRFALGQISTLMVGLVVAGMLVCAVAPPMAAQAGKGASIQLQVAEGTTASYRVQEQFVGINFPSDAVGTSSAVTGNLVLAPDGSIDSANSKLTIDLKTLASDQDRRDNYVRTRTFETDKFPVAEFVPRRVQGLPSPLPVDGQAGFQLTGDMTLHGVTKEVTWQGVATFSKDLVAGRAMTNFNFALFGLTKPQIARLLSVDDKIALEVVFRMHRN